MHGGIRSRTWHTQQLFGCHGELAPELLHHVLGAVKQVACTPTCKAAAGPSTGLRTKCFTTTGQRRLCGGNGAGKLLHHVLGAVKQVFACLSLAVAATSM